MELERKAQDRKTRLTVALAVSAVFGILTAFAVAMASLAGGGVLNSPRPIPNSTAKKNAESGVPTHREEEGRRGPRQGREAGAAGLAPPPGHRAVPGLQLWRHDPARCLEILNDPATSLERIATSPGATIPSSAIAIERHWMGHANPVSYVAYSPDGKTLASGSEDRTIKLWDAATGEVRATLNGHTAAVWSVAFSPTARRWPRAARTRRSSCGTPPPARPAPPSTGTRTRCRSVAFSPDGKTLASGSDGQDDQAVGRGHRRGAGHPQGAHGHGVRPWRSARTARRWPRASEDKTIKLWDVPTGKDRATLEGHTGAVYVRGVQPGRQDAGLGRATTTRSSCGTWPPARSGPPSQGHTDRVLVRGVQPRRQDAGLGRARTGRSSCGTWPPARSRPPSRGTALAVLVRGVQPGRQDAGLGRARTRRSSCGTWRRARSRPPSRGTRARCCVRGVQPGRQDAGLGRAADRTVKLWDVATGKERATLEGHTDSVLVRGVQPGRQDAGLGRARTGRSSCGTWRRQGAGHPQGTHGLGDAPWRSARTARRWPRAVRTGRSGCGTWPPARTRPPSRGTRARVLRVAFSPDGKTLASGELDDRTVRLWDAATGKERATLKGHTDGSLVRGLQPRRQDAGLGQR